MLMTDFTTTIVESLILVKGVTTCAVRAPFRTVIPVEPFNQIDHCRCCHCSPFQGGITKKVPPLSHKKPAPPKSEVRVFERFVCSPQLFQKNQNLK